MITEKKILVCCPQIVSGGPELLHQLVDELRSRGRDARIVYYPFDQNLQCPDAYRKYDALSSELIDDPDTFILVPEASTWILRQIRKARCGIWWLSVDNYLGARHKSRLSDLWRRYKSALKGLRIPLFLLHRYTHLAQSHYAVRFLKGHGIDSSLLTDYLGTEHLSNPYRGGTSRKEDLVVYNPMKGIRQTQELIVRHPEIRFEPIANMTAGEVSELLHRAKIYIDFGHHPGKDRPPREAAIAGCCVITGRRGAAASADDVPVPERYKLDDVSRRSNHVHEFGALARDIFENYERRAEDFSEYRTRILEERAVFSSQVAAIFG